MKESLLSLGLFFLLVGVTAAENNDENDFCQNLVSSIRTAYKRLKEYAVEDFEECRKLLSDSKEKVARLAETDSDMLFALAKEILLDAPFLSEEENSRGTKPPRLELKSALLGALTVIGGKAACSLLTELKERVESGEAEEAALGGSPASLLEVPLKFDRLISDSLEGKSENPLKDIERGIEFAQVHHLVKILAVENIKGVPEAEFLCCKQKALDRVRNLFPSEEPSEPNEKLLFKLTGRILRSILGAPSDSPLPDDWHRRIAVIIQSKEKTDTRTEKTLPLPGSEWERKSRLVEKENYKAGEEEKRSEQRKEAAESKAKPFNLTVLFLILLLIGGTILAVRFLLKRRVS